MTWFTLEPRDTLLVRDGRSMNGTVGRSLPMPHPPTIAGLVRTRLGSGADGRFDATRADALLSEVRCAGPLLARLAPAGETVDEVFLAAPADCVWFLTSAPTRAAGKVFSQSVGHRLSLQSVAAIAPGATTDLGGDALLPAFVETPPVTKPCAGPRYWSWRSLSRWLADTPATLADVDNAVGIPSFERELRTHVAVDGATSTAADGALFMTEGVRLSTGGRGADGPTTRWALLARVECGAQGEISDGIAPLGGERSVAQLKCRPDPSLLIPDSVRALKRGDRARVMLVTPALFAEGARPTEIAGATVLGGKVDRPEVVSGWDFRMNRPKPTRRMASAGSVYWVDVPDDEWATRTWLTCVSTGEQDQRDGFGLAVVGVGE